jgi:TonB family protein
MRLRFFLGTLLLLAASACETGPGTSADNPIRVVRPTREEIMARYPRAALEKGIAGSATVECEVISSGLLDHCVVLKEDPEGYGFGDAAIQVAFEHWVKTDAQGRLGTGKRVAVPITFSPR